MSQIHKGIFGSLAIALSLGAGAVQLAFAHDLIGSRQATAAAPETGVNRAGKSDRASVPAAPGQTQTIALRHDGVADTSVLVRVPVAKAARNETRNGPAPTAPVTKPAPKKITIACEPPVSVLTDVAKLLQPGRCVT
ncbi:hypothetical protein [Bradyrhizobium sp. AUGA SZCCT0431]|uniref:hypothetical protein n=1 Tax=Bradyrhizobium sp. AUGA SZCCT0431 TaxID=2807674 RepID=UPI001BABA563|nr:hypothetical protein [Bradyrhizobium sp. AUGA SZCCT0431]MBR1148919.1 hypothetical protein [Bradyrhizobium sp. AUGA SZCCT0431]